MGLGTDEVRIDQVKIEIATAGYDSGIIGAVAASRHLLK